MIYHIFLVALIFTRETILHLTETELLLRANDCQANMETQVILKFMIHSGLILAEIEHWGSLTLPMLFSSEGSYWMRKYQN